MNSAPSLSRIVLAEDNPADVGLVREALQEHNIPHELRVLSDGQEALAFIDRLDLDTQLPCPDLFMLDLHLPKHDGAEVLTYFRASERCRQTPVVVLTSSDSIWDQRIAEKHAALHFFHKPISLGQFMRLGQLVKDIVGYS